MRNGCLPLTTEQFEEILEILGKTNLYERNQALFILGIFTGFRISELLSLKVTDINEKFVTVKKANMKGKTESRTIPLHEAVKPFLNKILAGKSSDDFLFPSQKGNNKAITSVQAFRILQDAFNQAGLEGKYATHSMRKTFAMKIWEKSEGNLIIVQKALGHRNINSTQAYLSTVADNVNELILSL